MRALAPKRSASAPSWLGAGALVLLACGAQSNDGPSSADGPEASGAPTAASGGAEAAADRFAVCPMPLGSAEELALTPRADTNLELLALSLDVGHLTATQVTYERVVADIGALRAVARHFRMRRRRLCTWRCFSHE